MTTKTERRIHTGEIETRNANGPAPGQIGGYAAVFDTLSEDLGGFRETIKPYAFDSVLGDDVRALINHDPSLLLGRNRSGTLRISADVVGLRYEVDLPDVTYARDLWESLSRGDISQSSFGFMIDEDSWDAGPDGVPIRTITRVSRLVDVSPVTYPAYPDSTVAIQRALQFQEARAQCFDTDKRKRLLALFGA